MHPAFAPPPSPSREKFEQFRSKSGMQASGAPYHAKERPATAPGVRSSKEMNPRARPETANPHATRVAKVNLGFKSPADDTLRLDPHIPSTTSPAPATSKRPKSSLQRTRPSTARDIATSVRGYSSLDKQDFNVDVEIALDDQAAAMRMFRVPTPSTDRRPQSSFRSEVIDMEVRLVETLRARRAQPSGLPCPIRREVFSQLFEDIIERESVFKVLLRKIKDEYDNLDLHDRQNEDKMKRQYEEAQRIANTARDEMVRLANERDVLADELEETRKLNERLRADIDARDAEIENLNRRVLKLNPLWLKQNLLYSKIRELEADIDLTLTDSSVGLGQEFQPHASYDSPTAAPTPTAAGGAPTEAARAVQFNAKVEELENEVRLVRSRQALAYKQLQRTKVAEAMEVGSNAGSGDFTVDTSSEAPGTHRTIDTVATPRVEDLVPLPEDDEEDIGQDSDAEDAATRMQRGASVSASVPKLSLLNLGS